MSSPTHSARRGGLLALATLLAYGCSEDVPTRALPGAPSETSLPATATSTEPGGVYAAINASGLAVGTYTDETQNLAVAYDGSGRHTLASLSGGPDNRARGVNAAGWIVGESIDSTLVQRAVLWTSVSALPQVLGALTPGGWSRAVDVNARGTIVGAALGADSLQHAFRWDSVAGMQDLTPTSTSRANAVNDSGVVVGLVVSGGQTRGFVWRQAGGMQILPTLGGTQTVALDINTAGAVVGRAFNAAGQPRAFRWTAAGGMIDLGHLGGGISVATGIDDGGMVVGFSIDSLGHTRPFAWTPRAGMRDIGSLDYPTAEANGISPTGRRVAGGAVDSARMPHGMRWRVSEVNTRPIITLPVGADSVLEGQVYTFAPEWSDADNDPLRFAWSFGDGGSLNVPATTTPPTVQRTYADQGTYPVRVIATDPSSRSDTATQTLVVLNRAPTGTFSRLPNTVYEGQQFTLSVGGISDAQADLAAGIQVSFNCGYDAWQPYGSAKSVTCPGTPDDDTINVGARLKDKDDGITQYVATLITHNRLPDVTLQAITPLAMALGDTFRVRGVLTDAGTDDGPWRYRYHHGAVYVNGTVSELGNLPEFAFVPGETSGTASVSVQVWDSDDTRDEAFLTVYLSAPVVVNEALANEPGAGTVATRAHEFVEVVNVSRRPVDIGGWTLRQGQSGSLQLRHTFAAGTILAPGKAIVVFGGPSGVPGGLTNAVVASTGSLNLENVASCVMLDGPGSNRDDLMCYTNALAGVDGVSINRKIDGRAAVSADRVLVLHTALSGLGKSPGRKVDGTSF